MSEDEKNNIHKEGEQKVDQNQSKGENKPEDAQTTDSPKAPEINKDEIQSKDASSSQENEKPTLTDEQTSDTQKSGEDKKEHEVIHKKDGRLHIYVRQDKYKGELKSKNWVGRLYIDGKQKIS